MRTILTTILAAAAVTAAPAIAAPKDADAQLAKILAGRVAGAPTNCISLFRSKGSQIVPGKAVIYSDGGTLWVNRPDIGADSLDDDDILVTRTIGDQLCRLDTADLIDRGSRIRRGFISFGQFVPYTRPSTGKKGS